MKASGHMTLLTATASTLITTERSTKVIGNKTNNTVVVVKAGLTALPTLAITVKVKNMVVAYLNGSMAPTSTATLVITVYKETESIVGLTEGSSKGNGSRIKCMGRVWLLGRTVDDLPLIDL